MLEAKPGKGFYFAFMHLRGISSYHCLLDLVVYSHNASTRGTVNKKAEEKKSLAPRTEERAHQDVWHCTAVYDQCGEWQMISSSCRETERPSNWLSVVHLIKSTRLKLYYTPINFWLKDMGLFTCCQVWPIQHLLPTTTRRRRWKSCAADKQPPPLAFWTSPYSYSGLTRFE